MQRNYFLNFFTLPLICYDILKMASIEVKFISSSSQTQILKSFRVGFNLFPGQKYVAYLRAFFTKPNTTAKNNNIVCFCHQNGFKSTKLSTLWLKEKFQNKVLKIWVAFEGHNWELQPAFCWSVSGSETTTAGELRSVDHRKHLNSDTETDIHASMSTTASIYENPPTLFSWLLRYLKVWQTRMHGLFPDR